MTVSHDAIGYDPARHAAHFSFAPGSPAGRLLGDAMFNLAGQLAQIRQSEAPALAAGLCGLLRGLVLREPPGEDAPTAVEDARQAAMCRHIERNLHDLDLGAVTLCRAFGVSRATVYREFTAESGIARYITRRRLDWAFRELASHPPARGRVRAVHERWGFDSASHFSRLFRQRFGISPSDAMSFGDETRAQDPAATPPGLDRAQLLDLRPWFRRI